MHTLRHLIRSMLIENSKEKEDYDNWAKQVAPKDTPQFNELVNVPPKLYHVTKTSYVEAYLSNGIEPVTVGGYGRSNKTYFWVSYRLGVQGLASMHEEDSGVYDKEGNLVLKGIKWQEFDFTLLEIDTTKMSDAKFYVDPEFPGDAVITYNHVPSGALRIVHPTEWIQVMIDDVYPGFGWSKKFIDGSVRKMPLGRMARY